MSRDTYRKIYRRLGIVLIVLAIAVIVIALVAPHEPFFDRLQSWDISLIH